MKYRLTYITPSTYCHVKPTDPECQRTIEIQADSKFEAVSLFHKDYGFQKERSHASRKLGNSFNQWPIVWEIR